jgi:glutamyl-Q tRNA(Asp) synthetase
VKSKVLHKNAVGRFAPSPTGDLHLGSLVAATASYLNVKQQDGKWFVRIDDVDTARVVSGCDTQILKTLEAFGFEWDFVVYQSQRTEHYHQALSQLHSNDAVYTCHCTRKQLKDRTPFFPLYDRHCRDLQLSCHLEQQCALRLKTPLASDAQPCWRWQDLIRGDQQTHWQRDVDDFIVKRSDGFIAYHLACSVDDADFGITEVIRGADLLSATAPQQLIQALLGKASPTYGHHPLMIDRNSGVKLSKASAAPALNAAMAGSLLFEVLTFLGQNPSEELVFEPMSTIWQWAIAHWQRDKIKRDET